MLEVISGALLRFALMVKLRFGVGAATTSDAMGVVRLIDGNATPAPQIPIVSIGFKTRCR